MFPESRGLVLSIDGQVTHTELHGPRHGTAQIWWGGGGAVEKVDRGATSFALSSRLDQSFPEAPR